MVIQRLMIIVLLVFVSYSTRSQMQNSLWFFGRNAALDFSTSPPSSVNGSQSVFVEGCGIVSDCEGNLLFYTNGGSVWNCQHTPMKNGTALFGMGSATQTGLILQQPEHPYRFFIFSLTDVESGAFQAYYSIVDMSKENGLGEVIQKNTFLLSNSTEKITWTYHKNGIDCWVILHDRSNNYHAYLLTKKGVTIAPVVSPATLYFNDDVWDCSGVIKASYDGKKIAICKRGSGAKSFVELCKFNDNTGAVTNPTIIDFPMLTYGLEFSSNSSYLYVSCGNSKRQGSLYQLDLREGGANIESPITLIPENLLEWYGGIQLAMDKKIYLAKMNSKFLGVIHNPNEKGYDCKFIENGLELLYGRSQLGFPQLVQTTTDCNHQKGKLDTVYACVDKGFRIVHKNAKGYIISRKWSFLIDTMITIYRDSSVYLKSSRPGIHRVQLFVQRYSKIDTLTTYVIIEALKTNAGNDTTICLGSRVQLLASGGESYEWRPIKGLDNARIPNPIATPTETTFYIVKVVNKNGCIGYDTVKVIVEPLIKATVSKDIIMCKGDSVPLQAGGGTKYEWFPKSGLNNYFIANPIALPSTTTRYKVIISNATCTDSTFVTITIKENEKADAGRDKELCVGKSVRLGTNNNPQVEYSWSPADYLDNPKSANPLCTPEKNMQYILTVKNSNGCENYDTVNVTLGGELSVFAGADTSVCEGEQIQLNASGAENFSWSPAEGLSNATIANPLFTGTSTTQYIVTGKSGNCEGKDTTLVTVNEKPTIIASENREICVGDTVHLSAKGATEYSWSPAEGLNNTTIANPIFTGTKTTEYIVTGKNGNCFDSKKVIIMVNEKPTLLVSENRELCTGDTVHLSAKGALEYSWSPADGLHNPTIANPIFIGTKTTEYIVTGKTGNCFDSKKILITVNEKPTLSVSENREICLGDTVHLRANNADSYLWTPSTYLNNATIANPIAQPTENITYTVRGTNANGCYEEKIISIIIKNDQEKTISLQLSDTAQYAPGTIVPVKIRIPEGLAQTTVTLNYDPCCVRCDSIFTPNTGISTVFLRNNALRFTSISPNKQEKEIMLPCTIYLPPDSRKSEKFTLSDIIHSEQCLNVRGNNDEILYDPSCAWQFRGVQQTGRFGIESDGTIARLYTGYGGAITVKIFDVTGMEVWHYSSHYNSTDIQEISLPSLSSGMYIMQASNGVWHDECVMMK